MERQSDDTNGISKIRRISYGTITKLGRSSKVNGKGSEEYEKAI